MKSLAGGRRHRRSISATEAYLIKSKRRTVDLPRNDQNKIQRIAWFWSHHGLHAFLFQRDCPRSICRTFDSRMWNIMERLLAAGDHGTRAGGLPADIRRVIDRRSGQRGIRNAAGLGAGAL